jgi:seryl-tRNA synthetase
MISWFTRRRQRAQLVIDLLIALNGKMDTLLMDEQTFETKLNKLATDVTTAVTNQQTATAELKAEIAALQAGEPVSQVQLDALGAKLDAIDAAIAPLATV